MRKIRKLISWLCLGIAVMNAIPGLVVMGAENSETNQPKESTCCLQIETDPAQKTEGETLAIYQVGEPETGQKELRFTLTEPFQKTEADLYALDQAARQQTIDVLCSVVAASETAEGYAATLQPITEVTLSKDGTAEAAVPAGVYLIWQKEADQAIIQPGLISVPCTAATLDAWSNAAVISLKADEIPPEVPTGDEQNIQRYVEAAAAAGAILLLLITLRIRSRHFRVSA